MYKQIVFAVTATIMLTAFATFALYSASEAQAQNGCGFKCLLECRQHGIPYSDYPEKCKAWYAVNGTK